MDRFSTSQGALLSPLSEYFSAWRSMVIAGREIIDAHVAPEHVGPSPQLKEFLEEWQGTHYWATRDGRERLVLIKTVQPPGGERWWLHILLFLVTFATVWLGGSLLTDARPGMLFALSLDFGQLAELASDWLEAMLPSLAFAGALMGILFFHEMGHYLVAKRYLIDASPPYFLPAPPWLNFIGTFGAFIRIRSAVVDRRQLMDVGAAGPWAGFVVALVVLLIGLGRSTAAPGFGIDPYHIIVIQGTAWNFGDSLVLRICRALLDLQGPIILDPLALAGWVGVFVTMLNLLPLGQLDGGHIVYALLGKHQNWVARLMWYGLLVLGFKFWGWWIWAVLTLLIGRGRISHPAVLDRHRRIPLSRLPVGWLSIALFILTFTPVPFNRI